MITPDATIDIHELVVPQIVARNQTVPEIINKFNIADLRKRVRRGFHIIGGGALKIERPGGSVIHLGILKKEEDLARIATAMVPGWIVHRQIKDGDWCIFNRQPT